MAAFGMWATLSALASALEGLTGMGHVYAYDEQNPVSPYAVLRPQAVPILGESFGRGLLRVNVEVELVPAEMIDAEAAKKVYAWLSGGAGGLWEVLRTDPTLGGLVDDVVPGGEAQVGLIDTPLGDRFGARVPVQIVVRRDA